MENDDATIPETETALSIEDAVEIFNQTDNSEASGERTEEIVEDDSSQDDDKPDAETEADEAEVDEQFFEINGENISLTDLKTGFMKNSDYTVKTQQLAEQRRYYQENQRDVATLRVEALQGFEALKQKLAIDFQLAEQPDFEWLAENDQAEFVRQQHIWSKRENAVRTLYNAEMAVRQQQEAYETEQHEAALKESNTRFYEKYPELKDAAKSNEVFGEITTYLINTGFTETEIRGISDHRILDILYQNIQAQKAQKSIQPAVEKIAKKPILSQKVTSNKPDRNASQLERFNKTGSREDAAELFAKIWA